MKKEKQIHDLTWKYFKEQKLKEINSILLLFIGFVLIIFLCFVLGFAIGDGYSKGCSVGWDVIEKCGNFDTFFEGLLYLVILLGLVSLIWAWIKENWERAKERAEKELCEHKWSKRYSDGHRFCNKCFTYELILKEK